MVGLYCGNTNINKTEDVMPRYEDESNYELEYYDDDLIDGVGFASPGSALRAETDDNPRIHPCPTCHAKNVLTTIDISKGYQCDSCANACERGMDRDYVCGGSENGCEICLKNEE